MSARKKTNLTLTQNGVITEEAMLAYLNGMLTPEDTAKFEQLLADDPFAREAMEGLQATAVPQLEKTLSELHQKVTDRSGAAQPAASISLTAVTRYAVAAALIGVLVGLAFLITRYIDSNPSLALSSSKSEDISNAPEAKPFMEEDNESVAEQSVELPSEAEAGNEVLVTDSSEKAIEPAISAEPIPAVAPKQEPKTDLIALQKEQAQQATKKEEERKRALTKEQQSAAKSTAANSPFTATGNAGAAAPSSMPAKAETDALKEKELSIVQSKTGAQVTDAIAEDFSGNMEEGMQSFNNRDYKTAAKKFNKVLDKEPENTDAIYFHAVSEFINGNTGKAQKGFDKLLDKNSKHVDGAKFYKAQILLKKGKKEDAYFLLDEVSRGNSSFKQRAREKLEEIR